MLFPYGSPTIWAIHVSCLAAHMKVERLVDFAFLMKCNGCILLRAWVVV